MRHALEQLATNVITRQSDVFSFRFAWRMRGLQKTRGLRSTGAATTRARPSEIPGSPKSMRARVSRAAPMTLTPDRQRMGAPSMKSSLLGAATLFLLAGSAWPPRRTPSYPTRRSRSPRRFTGRAGN